MNINKNLLPILLVSTMLSGCSLAPDFEMPDTKAPEAYKSDAAPQDSEAKGVWKEAQPVEAADRGKWWKIFGDSDLDALEQQAAEANNNVKAAAARLSQARNLVMANASTIFPTVELGGNAVRSKPGSAGVAAFGGATGVDLKPYNLYSAGGVVSYEVDLFGRVRDNESALIFEAEGQEALYRDMLLMLQGDVAEHYFTLRALDAERALLRDTIGIREEAQRIMQKRFDVGTSSEQDLSRTQSELAGAKAELAALDRQRAAFENSLAVLLGKMPSEFSFAEAPFISQPPRIPAGLPSTLLQRRPDIVKAQTAMQAANKRIGVARTAYFPSLTLTASGGYESTTLGNLFDWSNRTWALGQTAGSALAMTLFDNGRTGARVDVAKGVYEEAVALYRQQVLVAFKEVENGLTGQRLLAEQSAQQDAAAAAAARTTSLTQKRYDEGDANYFEVVDAQRNSLAAERAAIQARGQRLTAAVTLVRALGGGWDETVAVTHEETLPYLNSLFPSEKKQSVPGDPVR